MKLFTLIKKSGEISFHSSLEEAQVFSEKPSSDWKSNGRFHFISGYGRIVPVQFNQTSLWTEGKVFLVFN